MAAKSVEETPNLPGTIFSVAKEIEQLGVQAIAFQCDVRNVDQIDDMVATCVRKWGR